MRRYAALVIPVFLADLQPLLAAGAHADSHVTMLFVQLALLILVGRLLGEWMQRHDQPAVVGQLLAGIVLGPTVFGALWPEAQQAIFPAKASDHQMLSAISELGVLMLLLLTGMETDMAFIKRLGRSAVVVSAAGIVVPFACGYALGTFLPASVLPDPHRRVITALFLATALSISSVKIVAAVLREADFLRRSVGQVILAAALLDDTIGWTTLAVIGGMASHGQVVLGPVILSVLGTGALLLFCFTIGHRWVAVLIRRTNDHFCTEMPVISLILVLMLGMALLTNTIGVHTVLGAFLAGVMVGRSPILTQHIEEQLRGAIVALFMPVFFGMAGLSVDLRVLAQPQLLGLALAVIAIASFGKLSGCYFGSRLARLDHAEALAIGFAMNARGSTEIILATIGLSMGALDQRLFTIIVLMAVTTTLAMPPLLNRALRRVPMRPEERARLEKEEAEEHEFLAGLERLLVVLDQTECGRRAGRLAGWLIGARALPSSVMEWPEAAAEAPPGAASTEALEQAAEEALAAIKGEKKDRPAAASGETPLAAVPNDAKAEEFTLARDVSFLPPVKAGEGAKAAPGDAIRSELAKGYGMLFLGVAPKDEGRPFGETLEKIVREFSGASAFLLECRARTSRDAEPLRRILLPITGSEHSRVGAEIAIAIAKGCGATVTAFHVAAPPKETDLFRYRRRLRSPSRALTADVVKRGKREGVKVVSKSIVSPAKERAILRELTAADHQLIVLGTKAWAGERLHFGESVQTLIEEAKCPLLIVKS